jgi:GDPmannose 4,6-dehydratase
LVDVYRKSYNIHATQNWTYNFESEIRGPLFVTKKITLGVARIKHAILNKEKFEPIELGNLDSIRSWQFAGDIVDAVWRTVNNSSPVDYVVSSDESHSIRELITTALNYANIPHYCTNDKYYSTTDNSLLVKTDLKHLRPSDVTVLKGNSNKIKNELSWQPTLNFDQLIKRMIEYDLKYVST